MHIFAQMVKMKEGISATIQIRVNLDEQWADQFHDIKKYLGVHSNAEVIRVLITEKWREVKKELGESLDKITSP